METTTIATEITEVFIEAAAAAGWQPEEVTANRWGGYDCPGTMKGDTVRVVTDDETVTVWTFTGGRAMLISGEVRLSGSATGLLATILAVVL